MQKQTPHWQVPLFEHSIPSIYGRQVYFSLENISSFRAKKRKLHHLVARGTLAEFSFVPFVAETFSADALTPFGANYRRVSLHTLRRVIHWRTFVAVARFTCESDERLSGFNGKGAFKVRFLPDQPKLHLHKPHSFAPCSQYELSDSLQLQPQSSSMSTTTLDTSEARASSITTVCF